MFSVPVIGGTPTTLVTFNGTNGQFPDAGLTLSADGSTFYGTTTQGGTKGDGTVFSVPVGGGTVTTLASFNGSNGQNPEADLTLIGNTLYGTTPSGGASNDGTVFSVPVGGGTPTTLASFNGSNGQNPIAGLTLSADGSTLYGTTEQGGMKGDGTVFSVPVTGGTPTTLVTFNGGNGQSPEAGLTLIGSTLYGTTFHGGTSSNGTVFSVPVTGGMPTALASFSGSNGAFPIAGLTLIGSTLYGTTDGGGGVSNDGTVFSVPVGGGTLTTLATFTGSNGQGPFAGLTFGTNGTLYGTTYQGGVYGDGTVFSLTPNGAPVPEASSVVSFGLLLLGGLGGMLLRAKRRSVMD